MTPPPPSGRGRHGHKLQLEATSDTRPDLRCRRSRFSLCTVGPNLVLPCVFRLPSSHSWQTCPQDLEFWNQNAALCWPSRRKTLLYGDLHKPQMRINLLGSRPHPNWIVRVVHSSLPRALLWNPSFGGTPEVTKLKGLLPSFRLTPNNWDWTKFTERKSRPWPMRPPRDSTAIVDNKSRDKSLSKRLTLALLLYPEEFSSRSVDRACHTYFPN